MSGNMYLLITDKEIAQFLVSIIDYKKLVLSIKNSWKHSTEFSMNVDVDSVKKSDNRSKFKEKLRKSVTRDLDNHISLVKELLAAKRKKDGELIYKNLNFIINKIGSDKILDAYKKSKKNHFVKSAGLHLSKKNILIRRKDFVDNTKNCFFRNMEGNESMLLEKMKNNYPFWFIDTGYTNFLESNKKWHRLVRNNLHHSSLLNVPVDRLGCFKEFPKVWRNDGHKILIIEPGKFSASTFNVNIEQWKKDTLSELRKYTDKPIVFREKFSKKVRTNLYRELLNEDYYCVVNINSNAATESIWAGIPVITLSRHITNSVSKSNISDINDLYRPHLGNWLCTLSYSQFTYEEIVNGTAGKIVKKYHG